MVVFSAIKVCCAQNDGKKFVDWQIQIHGGAGMCEDFPLGPLCRKVRRSLEN